MPKISCIMPVYNTEKYLGEAIESILNQTYKDFEFIISDDGSTDGSKEIINFYAKKDKRIIFLDNEKNRGIVDNLNDCIRLAKGEFIAIMESDDISFPDRFQTQINEFEKDPSLDLIGTDAIIIDENGYTINYKISPKNIDTFIRKNSPFINSSILYKKSLHLSIGEYDKSKDFIQDYDFFLKLFSNNKNIKNINKCLIFYRIHGNNNSSEKLGKIIKQTFNIKKYYFKEYFLEKNRNNIKKIINIHSSYIIQYGGYLIFKLLKHININQRIPLNFRNFINGEKNYINIKKQDYKNFLTKN